MSDEDKKRVEELREEMLSVLQRVMEIMAKQPCACLLHCMAAASDFGSAAKLVALLVGTGMKPEEVMAKIRETKLGATQPEAHA